MCTDLFGKGNKWIMTADGRLIEVISENGKTRIWAEICDEEPPFTHGWIYTEDKSTYRKLISEEDLSENLRKTVCVYKDLKTDREIAWQMRFPKKLWNKVAGVIGLPRLTKKLAGSI